MELRQRALQALCTPEPDQKVAAVLAAAGAAATLAIEPAAPGPSMAVPGRPRRPELIHPSKVPRRSPFKPEGLAALLHAIAHIEFNAINLALDAAWRFDGMPRAFYLDWMRVAAEESYHFSLLREHLQSLGMDYGELPAHDNLWSMCDRTKDDVVARMALVPRTLEARGLDATPQIQDKLRKVGTPSAQRAVEILDIILRDEIGHVAIGNRWYQWLCKREGLNPLTHYAILAQRYAAPRLHPPFNKEARSKAGFSQEEIRRLSDSV